MKLVRFNGGRVGVVRGELIIDVTAAAQIQPNEFPPVGMNRLIADFAAHRSALETARGAQRPINSVRVETPVPWPNKLIAFPINFKAHGEEIVSARKALMTRGFFLRAPSALSGASEPIMLPDLPQHQIHQEAEIGIVIGRKCRHVSRSDASAVMTVYPGDIIFGGTPAGISPIQAGDIVTIEIEQIGRMAIPVIQGRGGGNSAFEGFD